jgi:hypothetical protein
VAAAE